MGLLGFINDYASLAFFMVPFGASCVLLFASPSTSLSQPINVIAGHGVSAIVGLSVHAVMPAGFCANACAIGLAVAMMMALRILHPPAGATALVAAYAKGWAFLAFPVLTGSIFLVAVAAIYHQLNGTTYPIRKQS